MTGPALRSVIDRGVDTAVVPFGSVEQHGGHLPLGTDALLADLIGREVAVRVDAVFAPTVRVGYAEQHMSGDGTLTLTERTMADLAFELGDSLVRHGFRAIVLLSTHGGNAKALHEAAERLNSTGADVIACAPVGDVGPDPGTHSGKWLTSVMLALRPELVRLDAASPELAEELQAADPRRGAIDLERFVASVADAVLTTRASGRTRSE